MRFACRGGFRDTGLAGGDAVAVASSRFLSYASPVSHPSLVHPDFRFRCRHLLNAAAVRRRGAPLSPAGPARHRPAAPPLPPAAREQQQGRDRRTAAAAAVPRQGPAAAAAEGARIEQHGLRQPGVQYRRCRCSRGATPWTFGPRWHRALGHRIRRGGIGRGARPSGLGPRQHGRRGGRRADPPTCAARPQRQHHASHLHIASSPYIAGPIQPLCRRSSGEPELDDYRGSGRSSGRGSRRGVAAQRGSAVGPLPEGLCRGWPASGGDGSGGQRAPHSVSERAAVPAL